MQIVEGRLITSKLAHVELFIFTDDSTAKSVFYEGTTSSKKLILSYD